MQSNDYDFHRFRPLDVGASGAGPDFASWFNQALSHALNGEFELAEEAMQKSIKLNPQQALSFSLLSEIYAAQNKMGPAREAKSRFLQL